MNDDNSKTAKAGPRLGVNYFRSIQESIPISICLPSGNESGSSTLELEISQDSKGPMAISTVVWDAGLYLIDFLEANAHSDRPDRLQLGCTLELGTGTGICGIAAACLGAPAVVLSDIVEPAVLQKNIDSVPGHLHSNVTFVPYDWSSPFVPHEVLGAAGTGRWDTVLCSDVLYDAKFHQSLLRLLKTLGTSPSTCSSPCIRQPFRRMLLSYKMRHEIPEQAFFESLAEWCHIRVLDNTVMKTLGINNFLRNQSVMQDIFIIVAEPRVTLPEG